MTPNELTAALLATETPRPDAWEARSGRSTARLLSTPRSMAPSSRVAVTQCPSITAPFRARSTICHRRLVAVLSIAALLVLFRSQIAVAVCGQSSDVVFLERNGKPVSRSDFVVKVGDRVTSFCPDGICFVQPGSRTSTLIQLRDKQTVRLLKKRIAAARKELLANKYLRMYPSSLSYYSRLRSVLGGDLALRNRLSKSSTKNREIPLRALDSVPNAFTYENCSYIRALSIDVVSGKPTKYRDGDLPWHDIVSFRSPSAKASWKQLKVK
jgi:hypothetical protein